MWGTDSQPTPIEAVSTVIGTRAMGTGFNRLMTIQVPMKQHTVRPMTTSLIGLTMGGMGANGTTGSGFGPPAGVGFPKAVPMCAFGAAAPQAQAMPMGASGFAAPGGACPTAACDDLFEGLGTAKAEDFQSGKCCQNIQNIGSLQLPEFWLVGDLGELFEGCSNWALWRLRPSENIRRARGARLHRLRCWGHGHAENDHLRTGLGMLGDHHSAVLLCC